MQSLMIYTSAFSLDKLIQKQTLSKKGERIKGRGTYIANSSGNKHSNLLFYCDCQGSSLPSNWGRKKSAPFPMAKSNVSSKFYVEKFPVAKLIHFDLKRLSQDHFSKQLKI